MKKKSGTLILSLFILLSAGAQKPQLSGQQPIITAGRYFIPLSEIKETRQEIESMDFIGLYIVDGEASLLPVTQPRTRIGNMKRQVDIRLPDSIRCNKKKIWNKRSKLGFQYVCLTVFPNPWSSSLCRNTGKDRNEPLWQNG